MFIFSIQKSSGKNNYKIINLQTVFVYFQSKSNYFMITKYVILLWQWYNCY